MASKKSKKQEKKAAKIARKEALQTTLDRKKKPLDIKSYFILVAILITTFIAFSPSLDNGYVNWDDDRNFYSNELITTINPKTFSDNCKKIFKTHVIGNYNPLTILTFAMEQRYVDKKNLARTRHLNNILLHLVGVFFVFWIGKRLGLSLWGAVVLALLFGLHPMRVESVAWVTERKDVLFGAFYLAALYYYICGKQDGFRKRDLAIIGVCFTLSLFSKIQAVILPISMILVDYYFSKEGKITVKDIVNKTPLLIGSIIIGLVNIRFLNEQGSTDQAYSGISRIFIGSYSLVVYYVKALIPYKLSPLYPYPASLSWPFYASIFSFIGTAGLLGIAYMKRWKTLFFGLGFFIVNIALLLQVFGAGQGFLADRFTYIAYIGLFFLFAYGIDQLIEHYSKFKMGVAALVGLIILGYAYMTYEQNKIWKDSASLWTHVLKYYENSTLPWGNRANHYRDSGMTAEALRDYSAVIKLKDDKAEPYNSRARLYFNFNNRDSLLKALKNYNKAIELKPTNVEYVVNRGATYAKLGDTQNAIANLNQAEKIDPSFANIYLNRSVINNINGNLPAALVDIDKYLALKPNYPDMWYEKARIHNNMQEPQKGLDAINRAVGMNRTNGIYYFERAKSYFLMGQNAKAKQEVQVSQSYGFKGDPNTTRKIMNTQ